MRVRSCYLPCEHTSVMTTDGRCLMSFRASLPLLLLLSLAVVPTAMRAKTNKTDRTGTSACAVTHPKGIQPPVKDFGGTMTYDANYHGPRHTFPGAHGNGKLWTILPLDGKILLAPDANGAISDKFMWWRAGRGALTIEGHRLDAPAPPAKPDIPGGYHDTGFQASGITFPSEGCWQITGQVGDSKLTFVVEVHAKK